ncbi:MAG: glycosyltransferase [Polyangiaceae bacterium]
MRVALHMGTLRGHGSAAVGRGTLTAIASQARDSPILAWVPREWRDRDPTFAANLPANVDLRLTESGIARKLVDENIVIRRALSHWDAHVLFSLGDTSLPACPVPHVLLVQQAHLAYAREERGFRSPPALAARWRLMELYLRACLPSVTHMTVQTQDMKDRMAFRYGYPANDITVVPTPVELEAPSDGGVESSDAPYAVYVSSAGHHKNHRVLVSMMAALQHRHPDLVCRVTITREDLPTLTREVERRGLSSRFLFGGPVPHDRALRMMRDARVVVIPSKLESFGLPYYEAMGTGSAIVAADRAFAREACGTAALYADANDGDGFAEAVTRVLSSPALEEQLRDAARRRFEAVRGSWRKVGETYCELLEKAAQQRRR